MTGTRALRLNALPLSLTALLLSISTVVLVAPTQTRAIAIEKRATEFEQMGFYNVTPGGGSWLTDADTEGLGEPINVVISANSDQYIMTEEGVNDWLLSIQYGAQFLNQTLGGKQKANLGDGNGAVNQTDLRRYNYFDVYYGTLKESVNGGSHIRYWHQNGSSANSGAWFGAASVEFPASEGHLIVPDGYDAGRDELVGNATMSNGTISPSTNNTYSATVTMVQFLPANSSQGINHGIATDGNVAILTVRVTHNATAPLTVASTGSATSLIASTSHLRLCFGVFVFSLSVALLL